MDLTIVIVSFKSGDILHRCIKSIDKKYPIIIVENSQNVKLKEELEKKYSNVECILPDFFTLIGAGIIVVSGLYAFLREAKIRSSIKINANDHIP